MIAGRVEPFPKICSLASAGEDEIAVANCVVVDVQVVL